MTRYFQLTETLLTRDESAETVMETSPVDTTVPVDMVGTMGVHDSGMADKANASIDREMVETVRAANPLYGQHFGFDMTKDGMQNGSMTIWREGYPQRADVVIDGSSRQVWIPDIRMVGTAWQLLSCITVRASAQFRYS